MPPEPARASSTKRSPIRVPTSLPDKTVQKLQATPGRSSVLPHLPRNAFRGPHRAFANTRSPFVPLPIASQQWTSHDRPSAGPHRAPPEVHSSLAMGARVTSDLGSGEHTAHDDACRVAALAPPQCDGDTARRERCGSRSTRAPIASQQCTNADEQTLRRQCTNAAERARTRSATGSAVAGVFPNPILASAQI